MRSMSCIVKRIAIVLLIAASPVQADDAVSAIFNLQKSMIPMLYAATTVASLCRKSTLDEPDRIKRQRLANERIVQGLTESQKAEYMEEVGKVQAKIKAEFDGLSKEQKDKECAGL